VFRKKEKTRCKGIFHKFVCANAPDQKDIPAHQEQHLQVFEFQELLWSFGRTRLLTVMKTGTGSVLSIVRNNYAKFGSDSFLVVDVRGNAYHWFQYTGADIFYKADGHTWI
jgi:hypothetical protein